MGHTEHKLIALTFSTEQAFTDKSLMQKRLIYYFNVIKFYFPKNHIFSCNRIYLQLRF